MRISFDLDDVLFVSPDRYETEPALHFPFNRLFPDRLRKGTPQLIHDLQHAGFEVWVYTSSLRTETYIKNLFRRYGVKFDRIINGERHQDEVQRNRPQPATTVPIQAIPTREPAATRLIPTRGPAAMRVTPIRAQAEEMPLRRQQRRQNLQQMLRTMFPSPAQTRSIR